jgi:hypothetical protein
MHGRDCVLCALPRSHQIIEKGEIEMTATKRVILGVSLMVVMALAFVSVWAEPQAEPVGSAFTYQGQLKSGGEPVTDACDMEFRLYADAGGTSQVGSLVSLSVPVADGYFTAELDFGGDAFNGDARWLGIQVQCTGDPGMVNLGLQPLTPTPYALGAPWAGLSGVPAGFADNVDNNTTYSAGTGLDLDRGEFSILPPFQLPGSCAHGEPAEFSTKDGLWHCGTDASGWQPSNVIMVAKSGGDYTSIQAAIDSISDAAADNAYLVWIGPGVYTEQVTMAPYVHLQGAGQGVAIISSTTTGSNWPPVATLVLASDSSLRDLTVGNTGAGDYNVALMAAAGATHALVADVTAWAHGTGMANYAVFLDGSGTAVTLQQVSALAESASAYNFGLQNSSGSAATLRSGSFTARGGEIAFGIVNDGVGSLLVAEGVRALGEDGSGTNAGLRNLAGSATLRNCSFAARGVYASGLTVDGDTGTADVSHSVLQGDSYSVNRVLGTARVSHSKLVGSVTGNPTCLAVSTETLFYTNTCP